jgi:hypothetical protein
MMMNPLVFFVWLLHVNLIVVAQSKSYPSIAPPLKVPLTLSGTFCELRNTHFHAGIDLRTDGKEGMSVYAVEDGFVSRIRISGGGYGNALYIDHPNGYTSVYGHLQRYNEIAAFVRKLQFENESFEIDTLLPQHLIKITKGQLIAISGNTGASQAPHLHFEMRETITEAPVNPKLFGLFIVDNVAPVPAEILFYSLEDNTVESNTVKLKLINKGKFFGFANDTIKVNTTQLGLAVHVNDRMEDSDNSNGIHELTMRVNGRRTFHFQLNHLSKFDDVRYVLAHMDHKINKTQGIRFHRCFRLPGNYLPVYDSVPNNGIIELKHGEVKKIDITVSDLCKNLAHVQFYVSSDTSVNFFKKQQKNFEQILSYQKPHTIIKEEIRLEFPDSIFYDDIYFTYKQSEPLNIAKAFSSLHQVHTDLDPCHRAITISVKSKDFPQYAKDKALLVRENFKGSRFPHLGKWEDEFFVSQSKEFGKFYISIDTTPPVISPVNIYPNKLMKDVSRVRFKISDNLSGIHTFDMFINGKWVLAEYDAKSNSVWHDFDRQLEQGVHEIVFEVRDYLNNISVYKTKFRK